MFNNFPAFWMGWYLLTLLFLLYVPNRIKEILVKQLLIILIGMLKISYLTIILQQQCQMV
jgi:hypothetical protein